MSSVSKLIYLLALISFNIFIIAPTVFAHDSHSHSAPWLACEDKQKSEKCSYSNGSGDVFKGSCQAFSESLMCVRNEPIIHAEQLVKAVDKKKEERQKKMQHWSTAPEILKH